MSMKFDQEEKDKKIWIPCPDFKPLTIKETIIAWLELVAIMIIYML